MRFVLSSSNLEHVVVPEPSRVWVPLCYFAFRGTEFIGSCKMCNFVFFSAEVLVVYEIPEFIL